MKSGFELTELDIKPISSWRYPRILVGIPLERNVPHADNTFFSFARIFAQGPAFIDNKYGRIDVTRNLMVMELLKTTYTHLLMLDLDHEHPENIIQRLAKWPIIFGDEIGVVAGLNFRRKAPFDPVIGNLSVKGNRPIVTDWKKGLIPVDECGAAALLVNRWVFEKMDPPWFANIYDDVWSNSWPGEDIHFARKCKELGIPFLVDTTTSSPHCTTTTVTESTFRAYIQTHPEEFEDAQQIY